MNYEDHFERNPAIQGGVPVIKGTEVTLHSVMRRLAQGARETGSRIRAQIEAGASIERWEKALKMCAGAHKRIDNGV